MATSKRILDLISDIPLKSNKIAIEVIKKIERNEPEQVIVNFIDQELNHLVSKEANNAN